jgi:uncharacterized membrane protein YqjE
VSAAGYDGGGFEGGGSSAYVPPEPAASETRSLGQIVGDISADMSRLVRQEIDLAKAELTQEVGKLGKGAGMLAGAALAGFFLLFFVSFALVYLLDDVMPVELASLIVALVWGAVAAVLASVGRKNLKSANPGLPVTQQTLKEDAQWAATLKD